jgi:hypothetical protein
MPFAIAAFCTIGYRDFKASSPSSWPLTRNIGRSLQFETSALERQKVFKSSIDVGCRFKIEMTGREFLGGSKGQMEGPVRMS